MDKRGLVLCMTTLIITYNSPHLVILEIRCKNPTQKNLVYLDLVRPDLQLSGLILAKENVCILSFVKKIVNIENIRLLNFD